MSNPGDVKPVGQVADLRIDYSPSYWVYFIQRGEIVIILLAGGDKKTLKTGCQNSVSVSERRVGDLLWLNCKLILAWGASDYLNIKEDIIAYLEEGDPGFVTAASGDIARSQRMTQIARKTGLGRESLDKALQPKVTQSLPRCLRFCRYLAYAFRLYPLLKTREQHSCKSLLMAFCPKRYVQGRKNLTCLGRICVRNLGDVCQSVSHFSDYHFNPAGYSAATCREPTAESDRRL